jgi:hypothetical protein
MRIGRIDISPSRNPAILDTATWDEEGAARIVTGVGETGWEAISDAALRPGAPLPASVGVVPYPGSVAESDGTLHFLAALADGQRAFIEMGSADGEAILGTPVATRPLGQASTAGPPSGSLETAQRVGQIALYRADAATIHQYTQLLRPDKAPRALGATPRLGIGVRMSAVMWPGVYEAMDKGGFAANSIQNSMRELELLENILAARPPEAIYLPGFGTVESGHTGSTFEGLWVYGVLEALKSDGHFRYGADADHIKVARGPEGMARAKRVLEAARYYTFFTLDVSGVLDYGALVAGAAAAEGYLTARIAPARERAEVLAYHLQQRRIGGCSYELDAAAAGRLVGKYWEALDAAVELADHIRRLRGNRPFDLEFAIDERTPEIATCDCITSDDEVIFVLLELKRRGVPVTHLAPNFGVEKPVDYRCPDGLNGLEARVRSQYRIAEEFGVMLDFHSGDDLSSATRLVIGRATEGRNHFKVSPEPQIMFAEVVRDLHPELFRRWWDASLAYAQREAAGGSAFAAACLTEIEAGGRRAPSPRDIIFHNFGFAFVGKRNAAGQYLNREELYSLPPALYAEYRSRLVAYLCLLAGELFR